MEFTVYYGPSAQYRSPVWERAHDYVMDVFRRCLVAILLPARPDPRPIISVLETMASGRTGVRTSSGGIADMIVDGQSGLPVSSGDEHELTAAMNRVVHYPILRRRLASGGRQGARAFTAAAVAQRPDDIYAGVAPPTLCRTDGRNGGPSMKAEVISGMVPNRSSEALRMLMAPWRYLLDPGGVETHIRGLKRRLSAYDEVEVSVRTRAPLRKCTGGKLTNPARTALRAAAALLPWELSSGCRLRHLTFPITSGSWV